MSRLVLLSIENYRSVVSRADTRKAGRLETMPDDLFEGVKNAIGLLWNATQLSALSP